MLNERLYCSLLSILSVITVVITAIVLLDNSLQMMTIRSWMLFSVFTFLALVNNWIFYRLLREHRYKAQDSILE